MMAYATEQGALRLDGQENEIDTVLVGTGAENINTDDFMYYLADIPSGFVQYGNRTALCAFVDQYDTERPSQLFTELIAQ